MRSRSTYRSGATPHPDLHDRLVIDLDPGPGRTIIDCALVARGVQVILESDGIACWPKTSGSKGLHILAAIAPTPGAEVAAYAKSLAQSLESIWPHLVVHKMARGLREGRVLVDWSQNSHNKTTCAPYSVRCGDAPGVSTPLTWNEVEAASEPRDLVFAPAELLDRVEKHGDLIAGLLDPAVTTTVHS